VSACKIAVAGVGVFLSLPLGMWVLSVTASMSPAWLMCSSPLSWSLHEKSVKHIIYYLQCTRDKPLIMKLNKNLSLDPYCDSDFAGVWHQEFAHLRD
jgi:hypothetical protein